METWTKGILEGKGPSGHRYRPEAYGQRLWQESRQLQRPWQRRRGYRLYGGSDDACRSEE
uniref:Uncharacterized protein n=1 Tax=Rhizophora mucronata TaxID=61149 RepID=A0A2P2QWI1_RHIMU